MRKPIPRELVKHLEGSPVGGTIRTVTPSGSSGTLVREYPRDVNAHPDRFIQVPQYDGLVISTFEIHKNRDMFETLEGLASDCLDMPSVAPFLTYRLNAKEAALDKTRTLLYADGSAVPEEFAEDLWKRLSSRQKRLSGCWTWLNARFRNDGGIWYIDKNLTVGADSANNKILIAGESETLDCSIRQNCLVDLSYNAQGFPKSRSGLNTYDAVNNINFWYPRNDAVAWFVAGLSGAVLFCFVDPSVRGSELGVFACAAGVRKNSGGSQ